MSNVGRNEQIHYTSKQAFNSINESRQGANCLQWQNLLVNETKAPLVMRHKQLMSIKLQTVTFVTFNVNNIDARWWKILLFLQKMLNFVLSSFWIILEQNFLISLNVFVFHLDWFLSIVHVKTFGSCPINPF